MYCTSLKKVIQRAATPNKRNLYDMESSFCTKKCRDKKVERQS